MADPARPARPRSETREVVELRSIREAHPELKGLEVLVLSSTPTLSDARRPHLGKYTSLESLIATIEATLQRAA